jgi:hypothetical protein
LTAALEPSLDSFKCRRRFKTGGAEYDYFSLAAAKANGQFFKPADDPRKAPVQ